MDEIKRRNALRDQDVLDMLPEGWPMGTSPLVGIRSHVRPCAVLRGVDLGTRWVGAVKLFMDYGDADARGHLVALGHFDPSRGHYDVPVARFKVTPYEPIIRPMEGSEGAFVMGESTWADVPAEHRCVPLSALWNVQRELYKLTGVRLSDYAWTIPPLLAQRVADEVLERVNHYAGSPIPVLHTDKDPACLAELDGIGFHVRCEISDAFRLMPRDRLPRASTRDVYACASLGYAYLRQEASR